MAYRALAAPFAILLASIVLGTGPAQAEHAPTARGYHIAALGLIARPSRGWAFYQRVSATAALFLGPELDDASGSSLGNPTCGLSIGPRVTVANAYSAFRQAKTRTHQTLVKWTYLPILKKQVLMYFFEDTQSNEYATGFFVAPHGNGTAEIICSMPLATSDQTALMKEIGDTAAAWKVFAASIVSD